MAFWGIELRPCTPYTHRYDAARGRLRISQAILGSGKDTAKSVLQCNVGEKSPVLLCNLIPDIAENCHLELEFEEYEEVVFSVLGPRSVHLSGYYIGFGNSGKGGGVDSDEACGEDIAETESDESDNYSDTEDDYESDFIDDGDMEMFPSSPRHKSGVVIEEIVEDDKPTNGNANRRRLKKKHEVADSEDNDVGSERQLVVNHNSIFDSEDEDGFPISFSLNRKCANKIADGIETSDSKGLSDDRKRKIEAISEDSGLKRNLGQPYDSSAPSVDDTECKSKSKKKKKERGNERKALEASSVVSTEAMITGNHEKDLNEEVGAHIDKSEEVRTGDKELTAEADSTNVGRKLKKRAKEKTRKVESSETSLYISEEQNEAKTDGNAKVNDSVLGDDTLASTGLEKRKNKKKGLKSEPLITDNEILGSDVVREGHQDVENGQSENGQSNVEAENMNEDLLVTDKVPDAKADATAATSPSESKKKKKKKKNKNNDKSSADISSAHSPAGEKDGVQMKPREFPNGLIIEEVSMGQPDGKKASPGNKVSVRYIGKLKNGTIFDSNIGTKPFKFRLGIGQVIKGWDIGVKGMRIGDKRRLTIPPSLAYEEKKMGKIPANSWLIFDVELLDVQ